MIQFRIEHNRWCMDFWLRYFNSGQNKNKWTKQIHFFAARIPFLSTIFFSFWKMCWFKITMPCIEFFAMYMNKKNIQFFILRDGKLGLFYCLFCFYFCWINFFHSFCGVMNSKCRHSFSSVNIQTKEKDEKNAILHFALFSNSRWRLPHATPSGLSAWIFGEFFNPMENLCKCN